MIQLEAGRLPGLPSSVSTTPQPRRAEAPPKRTAPFSEEPGFYEPAGLWFYGNIKLLDGRLNYVKRTLGTPDCQSSFRQEVEKEAEELVLRGETLVCGIHNVCHMRAAIVPLRWGSPRILVFSGGFRFHLGEDLLDEPFLSARLWRYQWDARTDLVVSRRAPDKLPTFARYNPTVDHLIERLVDRDLDGALFGAPTFRKEGRRWIETARG